METMSMDEEGDQTLAPAAPSSLSVFHEDILLSILGYVADVPFEMNTTSVPESPGTFARAPTDSHSTLTSVLPLVSKQFRRLSRRHDLYWKQALLRLVRDEPSLWENGIRRIVFNAECDALRDEIAESRNRDGAVRRRGRRTKEARSNQPQDAERLPLSAEDSKASDDDSKSTPSHASKESQLLEQARETLESHPPRRHPDTSYGIYQCIYQYVLLGHLRYQAPVFCMPSIVKIGSPYGLHFFEPRYRVLIAEVMAPYPASARRGERIAPAVPGLLPPPLVDGRIELEDDVKDSMVELLEENGSVLAEHHLPTFIHAHQSLRRNTPAAIVQVLQCDVQADGCADVFLRPIGYVWLQDVWEIPGTGGLVEARGIRMGSEASVSYENRCSMRGYGRWVWRGWSQTLPIP